MAQEDLAPLKERGLTHEMSFHAWPTDMAAGRHPEMRKVIVKMTPVAEELANMYREAYPA